MQIAAGFRLLLLFFAVQKSCILQTKIKKREEQKKWTKINA